MGRSLQNKLPKYLEFNSRTRSYYYKNPGMERKAPLGKDARTAIELAKVLNSKYRIQLEQKTTRLEASLDFGSPRFEAALTAFVDKYIVDYRIKPSTAALLRQRRDRLTKRLGDIQVAALDTQMLREGIACSSQFEQSKMKTLLARFFRYAKLTGVYPCHLTNPVNDLLVDPVPVKLRRRMTMGQFHAIYRAAPRWL